MSRPSRITIDDKFLIPSNASRAVTAAGLVADAEAVNTSNAPIEEVSGDGDGEDESTLNRAMSSATLVQDHIDITDKDKEEDEEDDVPTKRFSHFSSGLGSGYSTAVNTPAATEDKAFLFPTSAPISRMTTRVSEDEKNIPRSKEGDLESYLPELLSSEPALEENVKMSKMKMLILGSVMMSTTFVASATNSATLLTIPSTAADLGITELQAQWVSSAYALANGCGLLFAGRLADLYGKKFLYLFGMGLYIVLSIVSGIVRNYIGICVLRAFAGLAISISLPAAFGIIGVTFTEEPYRTMAFSALALGYPVGGGPGMIIAGLVSNINTRAWQYVFFVLSGLALIPLILGAIVIPTVPRKVAADKESANRRIDWLGAFLITAALSLFSFSLTQSGLVENGWKQPYIGATLALSVVLMISFGLWEHFAANKTSIPPLVHLSIFTRKDWKVTYVLLLSFCGYLGISGWLYLTTIWYQSLQSDSPLQNAIHMLPAPIVGMGACIVVPLLAPRVKAHYLLAFGGLSTGIATMFFAVQPIHLTYWACSFLSDIFAPFGADFTVGIGSVLISNLVAGHEQSTAGALFQTALQLASTLGTCICSLISTDVQLATGSLETGLKQGFWAMTAFCWLSSLIALITLRKCGLAKDVGAL